MAIVEKKAIKFNELNRQDYIKATNALYDVNEPFRKKHGSLPTRRLGKVLNRDEAVGRYGLPPKVRGNPLGCGCPEGNLSAITKPDDDGYVYADYMCDSHWHNYFRFKLDLQSKKVPTHQKTIDKKKKKITLGGENAFHAGELEDY